MFFESGRHHTDYGIFNIFNNIVNDIIKTHIHVFFAGQRLHFGTGTHIKSYNYGLGYGGQRNV